MNEHYHHNPQTYFEKDLHLYLTALGVIVSDEVFMHIQVKPIETQLNNIKSQGIAQHFLTLTEYESKKDY